MSTNMDVRDWATSSREEVIEDVQRIVYAMATAEYERRLALRRAARLFYMTTVSLPPGECWARDDWRAACSRYWGEHATAIDWRKR